MRDSSRRFLERSFHHPATTATTAQQGASARHNVDFAQIWLRLGYAYCYATVPEGGEEMSRRKLKEIKTVLLALMAVACTLQSGTTQAQAPAPQRQEELVHLLRNDCGACHGLLLTGGLGPALRPETLQKKTADSLKQVILQGRPGTAMPGWAPFMTESEAQWLVELLVRGVSDED